MTTIKGTMIKYKLTDQNNQTYNGFQWTPGKWEFITETGNNLCSDSVFHFYDTPELAVVLNPIHADISNPKLWVMEIDGQVNHDGLKGGTKQARIVKSIPLPEITLNQKIYFAILCSLQVYKDDQYITWAKDWLSGKDRSAAGAAEAAGAAWTAEAAAGAAKAAEAAWAARAARKASKQPINFQSLILQAIAEEKE